MSDTVLIGTGYSLMHGITDYLPAEPWLALACTYCGEPWAMGHKCYDSTGIIPLCTKCFCYHFSTCYTQNDLITAR